MFNEVIIVEGKNDEAHLKEIYGSIDTVSVNGSEIADSTKELIRKIASQREIILFFDPDYPGQRIRSIIQNIVPNAKHAFIKRSEGISKNRKKIGVEHASEDVIRKALDHVLTPSKGYGTLKMADMVCLGLVGDKNLRAEVAERLNLGYANAKTLLNRLNMINFTKKDLEVAIYESRKH